MTRSFYPRGHVVVAGTGRRYRSRSMAHDRYALDPKRALRSPCSP